MSDYYKIDAVSNSMLSLLKRSPWTFYKTYVTTDPAEKMDSEETDAMRLGSAVHMLALEPEKFGAEYLVLDGPINPTTGKPYGRDTKKFEAWLEAEKNANANGRTILIREEFAEGLAIAQSFQSHPEIAAIMASRAEKFFEMENVFSYQFDSGARIDLKCKLDCVIPSLGLIIDLKSSKDPSPYAWGWSAEEYGYHRQAAIYLDAMEAKYGQPFRFLFGAVRSRKPYEAGAYYLDPDSLSRGRKEYSDLMDEYLDRKSTGDWLSDWQKIARQITVPTRRAN